MGNNTTFNDNNESSSLTTNAPFITQREIAKKLTLNPDTHPDLKRVLRHQRRVLNKVLPHVVGNDMDMSAQFKHAAKTGTMTSDHYHHNDREQPQHAEVRRDEDDVKHQQRQMLAEREEDAVVDHHLSTNTPLSTLASSIRSKRSDAYLHSVSQGHRSYLNDADIDADMYTFHEGHLGADMGLFNSENRGVMVAPSQIMTSTAVALLQTQAAENRNDIDKYMLPVLTSDDLLLVKKESVLRALTVTPPLTSLSICRNFMLRHLPIELIHHVSEGLLTLDLSFNQLQYLPLELLYKPASKNPYHRPQGYTLATPQEEDKNNEAHLSRTYHQDAVARGSIYAPPFSSMTALSLEETGFQQHPTRGAGAARAVPSIRRRTTRTSSMVSRIRSGSSVAVYEGGVAADMHIYKPAFPLLQTLLLNNNVIEGMLPHQLFSFNVMPALSLLNIENNLIVGFSSSIMNAIASRNVLSDVRFANNAFPNVSATYTHSLATTGVMAASERAAAAKSTKQFTSMMNDCEYEDGEEVGEEGRLYLDKWRAKAQAARDTESIEGCLMRVTGVYDAAVKVETKKAKLAQNALIMQEHSEALVREGEKHAGKGSGYSSNKGAKYTTTHLEHDAAQHINSSLLSSLPEVRCVRAIVDPTHNLSLPPLLYPTALHQGGDGSSGGCGFRQVCAPSHLLPPPVISIPHAASVTTASLPSPTFTASCRDNFPDDDDDKDETHGSSSEEQDVNQSRHQKIPKVSQIQQQQRRSHEQEKQLIMARISSLHSRIQQEIMDRGIGSVDELVECLGSVRLPISVPATTTLLISLQELVVNAADGDNASSSSTSAPSAPPAATLKQRLLNQPNSSDVELTSQITPSDIAVAARAQKPIEKRLRQHIGVPRCGMCDASLVDVWCRFTRDMGLTGINHPATQRNNTNTTGAGSPFSLNNGGVDNFKSKADNASRGSDGKADTLAIHKRTSSRRVLRKQLQVTTTPKSAASGQFQQSLDATDRTTRSIRSSYFYDLDGHSNASTTAKRSSRFTPNVNHTENSRLNAEDLINIENASSSRKGMNGDGSENQKAPNFFDETSSEEEFDAAAEEEAAATAAALEHSSDDSTPPSSPQQSPTDLDESNDNLKKRAQPVHTETPTRRLNRQIRRLRRHLKHMNIKRLREAKQLQYLTRKRRAAMDHNSSSQPHQTTRSTASSTAHSTGTASGNSTAGDTTLSLQRSTDLVVFVALLRQWDSLCRGIAELDNATQDRSNASSSPLTGLVSPTSPHQQQNGGALDEPVESLSAPLYGGGGIMFAATSTAAGGGKVPWAPQHQHQPKKAHQDTTASSSSSQERYHTDTGIVFGFDFDKCPDGDPQADIEAQIASEKHSCASEAEKAALVATHRHKWLYRLLFSHLSKFSLYDVTPCPPFALIKPIESLVANGGGMPVGSATTKATAEKADSDQVDAVPTTSSSTTLGGVTLDTSLLDRFTQAHKNKSKKEWNKAGDPAKQDEDASQTPGTEFPTAPSDNSNHTSCQPSVIFYTCGRAECVEELIDIIAGEGDTGADFSKLAYKPTTMKLHHASSHPRHTTSTNRDPALSASSSFPSGITTPTAPTSPNNASNGGGVLKRPIPTTAFSKSTENNNYHSKITVGSPTVPDENGDDYKLGSSSGFDDTTSSSIGEWEDGIDNYYPAHSNASLMF